MHHRARDISGLRVGYLTVVRYQGSNGKKSLWEVRCDCGTVLIREPSEILKMQKRGVRASCGCMKGHTLSEKRQTHGMSRHPAFAVWRSMVDRCRLPTHQAWHNYGARGIQVCKRWQEDFANFWADMGPTYRRGLTLERVDNMADYRPENCRWKDRKAQANNTRRNRWLETPTGRMTVMQAAEAFGIGYSTLLYRLDNNWPARRMFEPSGTYRTAGPARGSS